VTYVLIAVVLLVVALIVTVATRPAEFRIERSTTIAAPPTAVSELVNDFHKWRAWSPWEGKDPAMNRTYEGPSAGRGATYGWSGNKEVGEGRMTITESKPGELIRIRLEFLKPWQATNTADFTFTPASDGTRVNWSMTGCHNFMSKAFGMFCNLDKLVGDDFEKGLAKMKATAESQSRQLAAV
jgi:uncharacterized protein YndB with AHSA1/START domain